MEVGTEKHEKLKKRRKTDSCVNFVAAALRADDKRLLELSARLASLEAACADILTLPSRVAKLEEGCTSFLLKSEVAPAMLGALKAYGVPKSEDCASLQRSLVKVEACSDRLAELEKRCSEYVTAAALAPALVESLGAFGVLRAADLKGVLAKVDRLDERLGAKEGLRRKVERFAQTVLDLKEETRELDKRVNLLGDQVFGGSEFPTGSEGGEEPGSEEEEAFLSHFRDGLVPGVPVHLSGLASRQDLEGKAGWLESWDSEKQRWQVRVGSAVLLVRPMNIVP